MSLQNGIDNEAKIAEAARLAARARRSGLHLRGGHLAWRGPGRAARAASCSGSGPATRRPPCSSAILEAAAAGGVEATASPDVQVAKWEKYVLLAAFSAVSAATQLPLGDIRRSDAAVALIRDLMTEIWEVGRASGGRSRR